MLDANVHQFKRTSLRAVFLTIVRKCSFLYSSAWRNRHDDSIDDPFPNTSFTTAHPILMVCLSIVLTPLAKAPKLCARRWFGLDIVVPSTHLFHRRLATCIYGLTNFLASRRSENLKLDKIRLSLGHGLKITLRVTPLQCCGWEGPIQQPKIPFKSL